MSTDTDQDPSEVIDALRDHFEEIAVDALREGRAAFEAAGWTAGEIFDFSDEEYRWSFVAERDGYQPIDVTFEWAEARSYGDEPATGVAPGIQIVHYEGRILGGFTPHNYTPSCWVDARDRAALDARAALFVPEIWEGVQALLDTDALRV